MATANGTAAAPADFVATSGALSLGKGNRTRAVVVQVVGDTLDEVDETLALQLSNASGATIADGSGLVSILDDDGVSCTPPERDHELAFSASQGGSAVDPWAAGRGGEDL